MLPRPHLFVCPQRIPHQLSVCTAALAELEKAWRLAKRSYEENSESIPVAPSCREYSGQFNVRIKQAGIRLT